MTKIYTNENIPANQREWYRQRYSPAKCQDCRKPIVFMKNIHGNYVPCDAVKKIVNDTDKNGTARIMCEDGMISTMGRRFGWPVHECEKKPAGQAS